MPPAEEEFYSARFASRLKEIRLESGMNVNEIIERLHKFNNTNRIVPKRSGYYAWESGEGAPHYDLLPVLVKTFRLKSVHDLMPKK